MRVLLIVIIILVAASGGYYVLQYREPAPKPAQIVEAKPQVQAVNVLVARQRVPVGTKITEEMIDRQPWPDHLVLDGFIVAGSAAANMQVW